MAFISSGFGAGGVDSDMLSLDLNHGKYRIVCIFGFQRMRIYLTIGLLVLGFAVKAQTPAMRDTQRTPDKKETRNRYETTGDPIINIQFHYTYVIREGDMLRLYGPCHSIGFCGLYKMERNLLLGFDVSYQFGTNIKDYCFLDLLTNSSGVVLNAAGSP